MQTWAAKTPHDPPRRDGSNPQLRPLTAEFSADQHKDYVDHLNAALKNSRVRNIALTGRYGAGKSSVLEEFARQNRRRVLFLSLSSLGPENPKESRTNQIEKELVKQLLHRERPARLPQSRYQRIDRLPMRRALAEAAAVIATFGVVLWIFGVFPSLPGLTGEAPLWLRVAAGALTGLAFMGIVAWLRLAAHNRLEVSQLSAAGASVTVTRKSETYFDKYLDEVVYFLEARRSIDVIVFEDLDRFNQPGIFEALRELNTLLNTSRQVTSRPFWPGGRRTIRFVYAMRDSIFEQLGYDSRELKNDAAQAEAVRANRTKFFDLVIPLVPFITHRTARELLAQVLSADELAEAPAVSDELIDLVARHVPDMRFLINVRNEYAVFAKRLITEHHGMDTLTADQLFAMVAYKNLHLEDFELLLLGRSKLDMLYRLSRQLVTENIDRRRARLRKLTDNLSLQQALDERADSWGQKLESFFTKVAAAAYQGSILEYQVDGESVSSDLTSSDFWRQVFEADHGVAAVVTGRPYGHNNPVQLTMNELRGIVGFDFRGSDWTAATKDSLTRERDSVEAEIAALRTADFGDLAKRPDFTTAVDEEQRTFKDLVVDAIGSELGRTLVAEGYIDRYYNLYVAQYYGDRVPPSAMSFIVQNVDPNQPDIHYPFPDPSEVAALLKETNRSFLSDASAYNIAILDYLLASNDTGAHTIMNSLTGHFGEVEQEFLAAYLSDGSQAEDAIAYLAPRWADIFSELVESFDLTSDNRIRLIDVALAHSSPGIKYRLGESVRSFLQAHYKEFGTLSAPPPPTDAELADSAPDQLPTEQATNNAVVTLKRAGFDCDDLSALREAARVAVVNADCYTLNSANLRAALGGVNTISLDGIQRLDPGIYEDALSRAGDYLLAFEARSHEVADSASSEQRELWTIESPTEFAAVVNDLADLHDAHTLAVIKHAHPECMIDNINAVPSGSWEALAAGGRFPATLTNVDAYIESVGEVDADLASLLTATLRIIVTGTGHSENAAATEPTESEGTTDHEPDALSASDSLEAAKLRVARAILNASSTIPDPGTRAKIAASLDLKNWFPVDMAPAERGPLLGHLLERRLCEDSEATFAHFDTTDWPTLLVGIQHSGQFAKFVSPEILNPKSTQQLLLSAEIEAALKRTVLRRFDEFIPTDDKASLLASGRAALAIGHSPGTSRLSTIAQGTGDCDLAVRLLHRFRNDLSTDEVLDVLLRLDEPYSRLASSGHKLTFPRNDHHEAVLGRLKADGRITSRAFAKSLRKSARIEAEVL